MLYKVDSIDKHLHGKNKAKASNISLKKIPDELKQLNFFSKQVVDRLIKDGVPPTPENFSIYFEKLLDNKTPSQKEEIKSIWYVNNNNNLSEKEYLLKTDLFLKQNYSEIKDLMTKVNSLYSKINKVKSIIKKKALEIIQKPTKAAIVSFENTTSSLLQSVQNEQSKLKDNYLDISKNIQSFNKESIFDTKYDVYNKRYLLETIEQELAHLKKFYHKSSIVALRIKDSVLKDIKLQMNRDMIIKAISTMILDRLRRSDILAHFDDDIFVILLKHTDYDQAKKASNAIDELISLANFFIDGTNVKAQIEYVIRELPEDIDAQELLGTIIKEIY
jgi:GGDEF domain-containing protein